MPKLDQATAARVKAGADNADSGFEVLPEGMYPLRLRSVTVKEVAKSKEPKLVGQPMWVWEYEIPEGEDHAGRRFWTNRILPPTSGYQHADFMMAKFTEPFEALGGSVEDDTDVLIGKTCRGYVVERIIEQGAKAGEKSNSLEDLVPSSTDTAESDPYKTGSDDYDPDQEGFSDDPPF